MKKFIRNTIFFSLVFIAGIFILFLIPVDKNFSYHFIQGECENKAAWMYHRVFDDERSIDVVFSGASQTSCAIMDKVITEKLSEVAGKKVNAVNYGFCRGGRDIQYVMLKDLFKHKHPKILVLEVYGDEPKKGHPVFPYLTETKDLLESMTRYNQRYFSPVLKGIMVRFEFLRNKLTREYSDAGKKEKQKYGYRYSDHVISAEELAGNKESWEGRSRKSKPEFIRKIELRYSKHYIEKIINMAESENCKVLFVYFPEVGSNLKSPLLINFYEQYSEVVLLPDEIVKNRMNWRDESHLNDLGALAVSEYISSVIIKRAQ